MKAPISLLASLTMAASSTFAAPDKAVETLIQETTDQAVPHLLAAIELANKDAEDDLNYSNFATSLASHGFGQAPAFPEHWLAKGDDHESDDSEENDHNRQELEERVKMFAQYDIKFLKGLDLNGDLKTDEKELREGIRKQLLFFLNDKLKVDGNKDGKLSIKEYALSVPARGEERDEDGVDWHQRQHFEHDDRNNDGFIDAAEMISRQATGVIERSMLAHLSHILPPLDTDGDKAISRDEFSKISPDWEKAWKKASPSDEAIPLNKSYPGFYWVPLDELKPLFP